ncbi:10641_t:CDS:2, partial [Cetraspora pellucida]
YKPENKRRYKCKIPSFTHEYFDKVNDKGKETRVCNIVNKDGIKCDQKYKNVGSSTGNLITHLRDEHGITSQDNIKNSKKVRNSIITDFVRKPLSTVTNEAYKEKIAEFDPSFVISGEKKIRTMIVKSYKYNRKNLVNLIQMAENISLTIDFWSSRAKHGYLGVTAIWIMPNFKIKDIMLENKYVPLPYSSKVIVDELHKCIKSWKLEDHITSITTDNGTNMVSTFPLLNQKDGCERIKRLPCMAHTLQLAVGKGLAPAEILEATREFSGNTYVTLSKVIPTINEMIFDLLTEIPSNNNLFLDEDTVFGLKDEEIQPIDFDDEEIISNITKKKILIKTPLNTTGIFEEVKQSIYSALIYYWNDHKDLGLMAALLDPHYKNLNFLGDDSEKKQIIQKLHDEYDEIKEPTSDHQSIQSHPPQNLQHVRTKNIINNIR